MKKEILEQFNKEFCNKGTILYGYMEINQGIEQFIVKVIDKAYLKGRQSTTVTPISEEDLKELDKIFIEDFCGKCKYRGKKIYCKKGVLMNSLRQKKCAYKDESELK